MPDQELNKEMSKLLKFVIIGSAVILILFVAFIGYFIYQATHLSTRQEVASAVSISSEWTAIKPDTPMKIEKDFQSVLLRIEGTRQHSKKSELMLSDGTIINPEVEIFDENGNKYAMESKGAFVNDYDDKSQTHAVVEATFSLQPNELPTDRTYTEIRIRSDKSFTAKKVTWYNYNLK